MTHLKYIKRDYCTACNSEPAEFWAFPFKHKETVTVQSACEACAMVDAALCEADADQRRYTCISVGPTDGGFYNGDRCPCGAVGLISNPKISCVRCWKEERMLGKRIAEHKLFSRLCIELRRTIREVKKSEVSLTI